MFRAFRTAPRVLSPSRHAIRRCVLGVLLASLLAGVPYAQTDWTVVELGTLGGLYGETSDINEAGVAVGAASPPEGGDHAFLWTPTTGMVDLGTLGGSHSWATAINDSGDVAGSSITASGATRAFLWTAGGGMTDLGVLGEFFPGFGFSGAGDINDQGHIVGSSSTAGVATHAFLWTP